MNAIGRLLVGGVLVLFILGVGLALGGGWLSADAPVATSPAAEPPSSGAVARTPPPPDVDPVFAVGAAFDPEITGQPTADRNQSKLWVHDGRWWAAMLASTGEVTIHWLEWGSQKWHDTGVLIDERGGVRSDALALGDRLWIVTAGRNAESAASHARVIRFSFEEAEARYVLDAGFPATITEAGVEGISIARDSAERLWITYIAEGRVWFTATDGDDRRWLPPTELPTTGTIVGADQAAVVTLGDEVGIIWSNQLDDAIYYASTTADGPPDVWPTTRIVVEGSRQSDDHINVKTLPGPDGGIYAVVKTSLDELTPRNDQKPLIMLLGRGPDGVWRQSVVGRVHDRHSRPIVLIDEEHRELYVFATSPGHVGDLFYKRASIDDLEFSGGTGDRFIDLPDGQVSNPTSTKQPVNSSSGMVVLATEDAAAAAHYVHGAAGLGGTAPGEGTEQQDAGATPIAGSAGVVLFHDTFDWTDAGEPVRAGWRGSIEPPAEISVVAIAGGHAAALTSPTGGAARACREALLGPADRLVVSARVQAVNLGTNDAQLLAVGGTEGEVLSLRGLPDGRLAYTDGPEKVQSGQVIATGTWYAVEATINVSAATYSWQVTDASGRPIASGANAALQADGGAPEEVCFRTATGNVGDTLLFDEVRVSR